MLPSVPRLASITANKLLPMPETCHVCRGCSITPLQTWLIDEVVSPGSRGLGRDKLKPLEVVFRREQMPSFAHQDGKNGKYQFIEQSHVEQRANQRETAMYANGLPMLLLQSCNGAGDVLFDERCGLPFVNIGESG